MLNLSEELKRVLLAGIGAAATTAEKSKELIDDFVKKGELTVEQGKVLNEELKHVVKEKLRTPADVDMIKRDLEKVTPEELSAIKAKIAELEATTDESKG